MAWGPVMASLGTAIAGLAGPVETGHGVATPTKGHRGLFLLRYSRWRQVQPHCSRSSGEIGNRFTMRVESPSLNEHDAFDDQPAR